ncbi:MAG: HlyD family efflux transporter periplasmic adaptor subunit [Bacteroidota bacterium]
MQNKKLFPPEIIEFTVENYFVKQHNVSNLIYIVFILAIFVVLALLPLVKVDVTAQSRGIVRSKQENNSVVSAVHGEIAKVSLKNNQHIAKGDTLILIKTETIDGQIELNRQKIETNSLFIADLQKLLYGGDNIYNNSRYFSEYQLYRQKNNEQQIIVDQLKREFELDKELYGKKVIAKVEFEKKKNKYELAKSRLKLIRDQKRNEWDVELSNYSLQNNELLSKISQLQKEKKHYTIIAPISGTISEYKGVKPGNFISANQIIAQISPGDELIVECYVQPKDIGLICKDMNVSFQLDAFNYNQWGTANGRVIEVLEDIVNMEGTPVFKVKCKLQTSHLKLKNGYKGKLKKGMTLTSRFKLTRRSLFELLYDKTDDWLNPKMLSVN